MKKIVILLLGICILCLSLKIVSNSTRQIWTINSSSISQSIESKALVSEYEVSSIKYFSSKEQKLDLSKLKIWKEKQYTEKPFLIFFHPKMPNGKQSLILKLGDFSSKTRLYAKMKANKYSGDLKKGHIVLTNRDFQKVEEIVLYYSNDSIYAELTVSEIAPH